MAPTTFVSGDIERCPLVDRIRRILESCWHGCGGHAENNLIVLRIDNRIVGPGVPGNVHIDTTEPDCGINFMKLGASLFSRAAQKSCCLTHPIQQHRSRSITSVAIPTATSIAMN